MVATTLWNMVGSRERMDDNHHEFAHDDNDNDNIRVLLQEPLLQEEEEGVNKININKSNEDDDEDDDDQGGATIHSYYLWLGIMVGIMAQFVWYEAILVALLTVLTQSFSVRIAVTVTSALILAKFVLSIMICIRLPSDDDKNKSNNNNDQLEQEFMAYDDDEEQPMKRHADDQPRRTQEQEQQQAETSLSSSLSSQRAIGCFCVGVLVGICIAIVIVDGLLLLDNQPLYSWRYFQAVVLTSRH